MLARSMKKMVIFIRAHPETPVKTIGEDKWNQKFADLKETQGLSKTEIIPRKKNMRNKEKLLAGSEKWLNIDTIADFSLMVYF